MENTGFSETEQDALAGKSLIGEHFFVGDKGTGWICWVGGRAIAKMLSHLWKFYFSCLATGENYCEPTTCYICLQRR